MKKYQIADFIFGIHMEESLEIPENFKKFLIDTDEEVQVEYFLEIVDKLPELDGECVSQRIDLKVYKKDNLEYRRMNFMGMEESYGQYEEISQDQVKLYLKREFVHMINVDTVFVSLFAMEKRMLAKDAMVLHCSVLKVKSGVILFSGPSGIGKSTQAGLWTKYRKARVINGDRTLLKKENGRWMSLGWCKLRASKSKRSKVLKRLEIGTPVTVYSTSGKWRKVSVNGKTGYVLKKYVYINTDAPALEGTTYDKGQTVAQFAQRFVGNSYVWGGTDLNRGADCSGFIGSVYRSFGYNLPRTSSELRKKSFL